MFQLDDWAGHGYMVSMLFYKDGQLKTCGKNCDVQYVIT